MCDCMQQDKLPSSPVLNALYSVSPDSVGFATLASARSDPSKASATVVISTGAVDRQRESILSAGVDFSDYKTNPAVLWEHGLDPAVPFPLGSSESPDRVFTVRPVTNGLEATCFFAQSYPEAMQVFALVDERVIRAASIQAIPDPSAITRDYDQDGRQYTVIQKCSMVEWSWGRIGVNPEAVRKTLCARRVGQERLLPSFRAWLEPMAAKRKSYRIGYSAQGLLLGRDRYARIPPRQ